MTSSGSRKSPNRGMRPSAARVGKPCHKSTTRYYSVSWGHKTLTTDMTFSRIWATLQIADIDGAHPQWAEVFLACTGIRGARQVTRSGQREIVMLAVSI